MKIEYIGHSHKSGWSGDLPFFRTSCPEHGSYTAYPRGKGWLRCLKQDCFYEVWAPKVKKIKYVKYEDII